jgi:MYXO-CTERM domain-containing protein
VTLPNVECDNCTLQVIQVMEDNAFHGDYDPTPGVGIPDIYHQCIDLVLKAGAPMTNMTDGGAGAGGTGGGGGAGAGGSGGGGGTGGTGGSGATSKGGCAMGGAASPRALALLGLLVVGAMVARRRRAG